MKKFVMVNYPEPTSGAIQVNYRMTKSGDLQTIECIVDKTQPIPSWLQLEKFVLVSIKIDDTYDLLFEHKKYDKNLDTVLFLDEVFAEIMRTESYRIAS